ncbi:hypothetical protein PZH39_17525, partial [Desulfovibrio desulfuricans]|uniref:hypothetical protein n=1 Tax=Desulfovibrio desulfuricans TaxID=876 RepID=UPI0023AED6CD
WKRMTEMLSYAVNMEFLEVNRLVGMSPSQRCLSTPGFASRWLMMPRRSAFSPVPAPSFYAG